MRTQNACKAFSPLASQPGNEKNGDCDSDSAPLPQSWRFFQPNILYKSISQQINRRGGNKKTNTQRRPEEKQKIDPILSLKSLEQASNFTYIHHLFLHNTIKSIAGHQPPLSLESCRNTISPSYYQHNPHTSPQPTPTKKLPSIARRLENPKLLTVPPLHGAVTHSQNPPSVVPQLCSYLHQPKALTSSISRTISPS